MKVSSRIEGSICGAILSNRPSSTPLAIPRRKQQPGEGGFGLAPSPKCRHLQIKAALRYSHRCYLSASWLPSTFLSHPTPRKRDERISLQRPAQLRYSHVHAAAASATRHSTTHVFQHKDNLLAIVDQEDAGTVDEHLEFFKDPYLRRYAQPDGPNIIISDKREDLEYPSLDQALRGDETLAGIAGKLMAAVSTRIRHQSRISLDSIYKIYSTLPEPRMLHISSSMRHRLLRAFGTPRKKDSKSMLRYYSLIGDVKDCGLTIRRNEWNFALAFASRYVGTTTDVEAESTLHLWREMEKVAGTKGNHVTFNILFDVASKSGNFALAEMIYGEMESRGVRFTRYHHVSLIHFFGLKMDGGGVRAAYREMVDAGEMIDTVVLNCVIASFLRAGEDVAALKVYDHMKGSHSKASILPERNYIMDKVVTQVLSMFTKVGKRHPSLRNSFQELAKATPDLQTYRILLNHYAIKIGNLNKVAQYLDQMKWFDIPIHGSIFLILFKGFISHGGFPGSDWSSDRLHDIFSALLQALDDEVEGLYIDTWLAIWSLRAFKKCTTNDGVMDAYGKLKLRWKLEPARSRFMEEYLENLLGDRDSGVYRDVYERQPKGRGLRKRST